jgi:Na+-translocating ferredoxin:NAD+ oxidoreductase subunit B
MPGVRIKGAVVKKDIYDKLVEHYKGGMYGITIQVLGTEAIETFKEALKKFFTLDEAELGLKLKFEPETIADLCKRTGEDEKEIYPLLKSMSEKATVCEAEAPGENLYVLLEWVPMMENFIRRTDKSDPFVEKLILWWEDIKLKAVSGKIQPPLFRSVPVGVEIEKDGGVLPYDDITQLIKKQDYIAVAECYCRKPKRLLGEEVCDHPLEVCFLFGPYAQYLVNYGYGREISHEESLSLLKDCEDRGLVHVMDNTKEITFLCNCCGCCCATFSSNVKMGRPCTVSSSFIVSFDPEKCAETGTCGTCVDRCELKAITIKKEGDLPIIEYEKCVGCGSCAHTCPGDALQLKTKDPAVVPPDDDIELYERRQNSIEQLSTG